MLTEKIGSVAFAEAELQYLSENTLGRLATTSPQSAPHVIPIAYEFDGKYIYFGTSSNNSLKIRNIKQNSKVALVVDDVVSMHPWRARGIEIRGTAEILEKNLHAYVKITPLKKASWGLWGGE